MPRTARATASIGYLWHGALPPSEPAAEAPHTVLYDRLGQRTPVLEPDPPAGCFLHLATTGRYAPPLATHAQDVLAGAAEAGYATARLGIAPTPGVARLAARYGRENPLLLEAAGVDAFLAPLPISAITMVEDDLARLHLVGLRTLGDLRALPRGALGDYLGPAAGPLEALARGEDARPLIATRAPLVILAARELDYTLTDREQLARLLERLLRAPLATLRRQGLGVTRATLGLERLDGATTTSVAALAHPTTNAETVREALTAALATDVLMTSTAEEEFDPSAGITSVRVTLTAPRALESRQRGLFDAHSGRERLLRAGVAEARRRATASLGHLQAADPANVLAERRYTLGATTDPPGEEDGA